MTRLRTVSPNEPGWTRRRAGTGFVYLDPDGNRLPGEAVARIKSLVIPPAWRDLWICPVANGHLQAVGTDDAGGRQYLYHPEWRRKREEAKFDRVLTMARRLPKARAKILSDLADDGLTKPRVLATAARLIDIGYFRIGSDEYADEYGSYGLTTLERRHVTKNQDGLTFCFVGKSGIEHTIEVQDAEVCAVVHAMRRRRGVDDKLLAYKDGGRWSTVSPADVNGYLQELLGDDVTAKDFRTWHATVIAAAALASAGSPAASKTARKRAIRAAAVEVAEYLGNTPAVAKGSYVDPRVIDLYEDGTTIAPALQRLPESPQRRQEQLERAVLRLLANA